MDYSQNEKSLITYDTKDSEWKFGTNGVEEVFRYNIESSGFSEKVIIEKGLSNVILPNLITKNKEYDIIFIDGNHVAPFVLMDSVLSWNLLKPGGILIFDDYLWMPDSYKSLTPKLAVDSFIEVFEDYVEVILDKYRKAIKKI